MKKLMIVAMFVFTISRNFGGFSVNDSNGTSTNCQQTFSGYSCS